MMILSFHLGSSRSSQSLGASSLERSLLLYMITSGVWLVPVQEKSSPVTRKIRPIEESPITIKVLNSSYVFPEFDPNSAPGNNIIRSAVIQYPIVVSKPLIPTGSNLQAGTLAVYTMYIDNDWVWEFLDDFEMARPRRNVLGFVPLAHNQNLPLPISYFGVSDIDQILDNNEHMNDIVDTMKKVVEYNGEPTTVGYGFKVENMVKGVDKMISGLPPDARIENLMLEGNQAAAKEIYELIKKQLFTNANSVEEIFGGIQSLTNVTQTALKINYMSMWEKTKRKQITYGQAIKQVNTHILRIAETYHGIDLVRDYGAKDESNLYETKIVFGSPFPQDEKEQLEIMEMKKRNGWISDAEALRSLSYANPERVKEEIIADRIYGAMSAVESSQANSGQTPNLYAFLIDSVGVSTNAADKFADSIAAFVESTNLIAEHRQAIEGLNEARQLESQLEQEQESKEKEAQQTAPEKSE